MVIQNIKKLNLSYQMLKSSITPKILNQSGRIPSGEENECKNPV